MDKDIAHVIDHNYLNSNIYIEKDISLSNLLIANRMYQHGMQCNRYSCRVLKKKKQTRFSIWDEIDADMLIRNKANSKHNLEELKTVFISDVLRIDKVSKRVDEYLQELKTWFYVLSKTRFFSRDEDCQRKIALLIAGYSNLLSTLWRIRAKNDYEYGKRYQESIDRKIEEMLLLEEQIYNYLLEGKQ